MTYNDLRLDYRVIYDLIEPGARVLDLGCGSGDLMYLLARDKAARVQGVELDEAAIYECVRRGLSVFHGDIQSGLEDYPAGSFDYVILNQSIQEVERVDFVIGEALRVGRKVVIGFPNFAYWKARFMLFFRGRAPITPSLPYHWYDTPNVRFLSVTDFREYCGQKNLHVLSSRYLGEKKEVSLWPNLFALNAIFLLTKAETPPV
ncbi:MAG: hypothetical protein A4E73_00842 [Syntrophaceae bacterium PtaU1.Bin231]|nr:MAG: hypothetical protein A4E73_00842 [Syntrophaceae bacterium PtaU1.Bin231]